MLVSKSVGDYCSSSLTESLREGFATLVPLPLDETAVTLGALLKKLLTEGCGELCFVGTNSELVHDVADAFVEDRGDLHIVTTAFSDVDEALEYFVYGAGAAEIDLLALVGDVPELATSLLTMYEGQKV